ncbi:hypothetical protein [Paraoerskovia marina]|nr:hypothetical protein [Paraoerskovia marina]
MEAPGGGEGSLVERVETESAISTGSIGGVLISTGSIGGVLISTGSIGGS